MRVLVGRVARPQTEAMRLVVLALASVCGAQDFLEKRDLVFAEVDGQQLAMDLMLPRGDGLRPAILCLHGGGWNSGDRSHVRVVVQDWARAGYVAATASYRLSTTHTWPAQLEDVAGAVRFLRQEAKSFGIDPERIAATGFSAGGHLALMLGCDAARTASAGGAVRAVVNYFGPTDLRGLQQFGGAAGVVRQLAGDQPFADLSPLVFVDAGDAPVITLHGRDDSLVPFRQAEALHGKLRRAGVPQRLELLDDAGHGWSGRRFVATQASARAFVDTYLRAGDLPLCYAADFAAGEPSLELIGGRAWRIVGEGLGRASRLVLGAKSAYVPTVRSPTALALVPEVDVGAFVLDVDARSTTAEYGHRDLVLVFGYQAPDRFYYAHLASKPDDRAHGVFLVNGADRVNITKTRDDGMRWRDGWHRLRVRRDAAGAIAVFADDFAEPKLTASDLTLPHGRVGVGSFDDCGEFDAVRVYGVRAASGAAPSVGVPGERR